MRERLSLLRGRKTKNFSPADLPKNKAKESSVNRNKKEGILEH